MEKNKELEQLIDETITSTYILLSEVLDINNIYEYKRNNQRKNLWLFTDMNNINHFIIINKDLKIDNDRTFEIKFGWLKNNKPNYEKPQNYDDKVFNTHIHILINDILKEYDKYNLIYSFKPTDKYRFRLYKIAITKFLDLNKYNVEYNEKEYLILISNICK